MISHLLYLRFLVKRMLPVPLAILGELQLALGVLSILCRRVVATVAFRTLKSYQLQVFRFSFGHPGLPSGS